MRKRSRKNSVCVFVLFANMIAAATGVCAEKPSKSLQLSWKETKTSVALLNGGKVVWRSSYDPKEGKPYLHPLATIDGEVLTELQPGDHQHHRAGWFAWKFINGLNYWEEDNKTHRSPGRTDVVSVKVTKRDDHSARIDMTLSYHPADKLELMIEHRTLTISPPQADGTYHIDWSATFTARDRDLVLDRTPLPGQPGGKGHGGYAGLSIRAARAHRSWVFLDSEGRKDKSHRQPAVWVNHSGKTRGGKTAGVTMFDHPSNPRHPSKWFIVKGMPYFSPAIIHDNPMTLKAGQKLRLFYRILVESKPPDAKALDAEFEKFSKVKAEAAAAQNAAPMHMHHVSIVAQPLQKRAVPKGFEKPDHTIELGVLPRMMRYKVERFWVKPNSKVKLTLTNTDDMPHNLVVCKRDTSLLEIAQKAWTMDMTAEFDGPSALERHYVPDDPRVLHHTRLVNPGQTDEVYFSAPEAEGDYPYVCSLPGHAFTMRGVMTVSRNPKPMVMTKPPLVAPGAPGSHGQYELIVHDRPLVQRVHIAGATPRTMAIGLPGAFNYTFDPERLNVPFVWRGRFLDVKGERTGRGTGKNQPLGARFDVGAVAFPLRVGSPTSQPRQFQFNGYLRDGNKPPTIYYTIDGVKVSQQIVATDDGKKMQYRFAATGAPSPLYFLIDKTDRVLDIESSAGKWQSGRVEIPAKLAGGFMITLTLDTPFDPRAETNLALGAKATSPDGLNKDGTAVGDHGAVDGDMNTFWDETDNQKLYKLKLELPAPRRVSSITIVGYEHHNFAPKSFDIVINGKVVKRVKDAVYDDNLLVVRFAETQCSNLELNIAGYYGRSPAIRELGLHLIK